MEKDICKITTFYSTERFIESGVCGKNVKYKVRYRKATTGEFVEDNLCGIHFRQIQNMSIRIKNKTGYDNEFSYIKIN